MATAQLFRSHSHIDLENGHQEEEDDEGSLCFSDAAEEEEEEGDDHSTYSSYSQFYSTNGGSIDGTGGSSPVEIKVHSGKVERICRICHLSLVEEGDGGEELGIPIELGCSCKDDLGTAHKHCAETWFKIKGNKICEICNCTARNVVGPNENADLTQQSNENANSAGETSAVSEPHRCWQGNRFMNFLLACMVFAFVISWLFHFKVPS